MKHYCIPCKVKTLQLLVLMVSLFLYTPAKSCQINIARPEVGKPIPDFRLSSVTHYKKTAASRDDFKGKWLFMDFWSVSCVTCVQSFKKVNSLHNKFNKELTWILVGITQGGSASAMPQFYEKVRAKQNLEMPSAYDSTLAREWKINAVPHIIIVDPQGVVRFITDGRDMTEQKVNDLLSGKPVTFFDINRAGTEHFNEERGLDNTGEGLICSSKLTKWDGEKSSGGAPISKWINWPEKARRKGYNFAGVPLYWLYNHAYWGKTFWDYDDPSYGKIYPAPILELKDSSVFQYDLNGKGTYNYSLFLPSNAQSQMKVMDAMQQDLMRAFGYEVSIEVRDIPVWKLVAVPGAVDKLKTKGDYESASQGSMAMGFKVTNWPAEKLISLISFYLQEKFSQPLIPFVDETGLKENFDLVLDADMTNIEDVRRALREKGLDLKRSFRNMQVLVIRDPNQ